MGTTTQPKPAPWGEMKERTEPRYVKFADGEVVEGTLMNIERANVGRPPKPASRYLVLEDDGEQCCFIGTFQIDSKLLTSDIGHRVMVRCEGTDPNVTRNGNAMKKFKVLVSEKPVTAQRGSAESDLGISDADIPF